MMFTMNKADWVSFAKGAAGAVLGALATYAAGNADTLGDYGPLVQGIATALGALLAVYVTPSPAVGKKV